MRDNDEKLQGNLPAKLGCLTNLEVSGALSINQLSGTIPSELGNLSNLQELDLDRQQVNRDYPL